MTLPIVKLRYLSEQQRTNLFNRYKLTEATFQYRLPVIMLNDPAVQRLGHQSGKAPLVGDLVIAQTLQVYPQFNTPYVISDGKQA